MSVPGQGDTTESVEARVRLASGKHVPYELLPLHANDHSTLPLSKTNSQVNQLFSSIEVKNNVTQSHRIDCLALAHILKAFNKPLTREKITFIN